jgi:hypothetical protein
MNNAPIPNHPVAACEDVPYGDWGAILWRIQLAELLGLLFHISSMAARQP